MYPWAASAIEQVAVFVHAAERQLAVLDADPPTGWALDTADRRTDARDALRRLRVYPPQAPPMAVTDEGPVLLYELAGVAADGAYDKRKVYRALEGHDARILIPPRRNARIWRHANDAGPPLPRDQNLRHIRRVGRKAWKRAVGYHIRSLAETGVFRMKTIFGDHLASRRPERQVTEGAIRGRALNVMTHLGMPDSDKVA